MREGVREHHILGKGGEEKREQREIEHCMVRTVVERDQCLMIKRDYLTTGGRLWMNSKTDIKDI